MTGLVLTKRHVLLGGLAALLLQVQAVSAGLFTTEQALGNFTFTGDRLDYHPSPQGLSLHAPDSASLDGGDPDPDLSGGAFHIEDRTDSFGKLTDLSVTLFGSLPPADSYSELDLLKTSLESLRGDHEGTGSLAFLAEGDAVTGSLANRYRSAGVFVLVDGVDQINWVNGFEDAVTTAQLLGLEDGVGIKGEVQIPLPGTLVLLLGGLPLLWRYRRSG